MYIFIENLPQEDNKRENITAGLKELIHGLYLKVIPVTQAAIKLWKHVSRWIL